MQANMADNRPLKPSYNSDQLKPTRNSSILNDSRGIQWRDQPVDHCSMWRPWCSRDHSALVEPHQIIERRDQLVHGCFFVKTEEDLFMARMGRNVAGSITTAYSGGTSQETFGFCSTEKSSCKGSQTPHCQAEGCTANLSSAKQYHRRHKICELHSKASAVIVCGLIQRFCQQCSRFHLMSRFDERKRSCRKSLAEHNRRRRKPQASPYTASECEAGTTTLGNGNQNANGSSGDQRLLGRHQ